MTSIAGRLDTYIEYPSEDGEPMAESDFQRDSLIDGVKVLEIYFQNQDDVYVSGNLLIYYKKGDRDTSIAPDVFVVFGVDKKQRSSYLVWEEGKAPDFVLEILSPGTKNNDLEKKPETYASLGVKEYFIYDPIGDLMELPLKAMQLVGGSYQDMAVSRLSNADFSISSTVLGLEVRVESGELAFYDPKTGKKLLTHEEENAARIAAETRAFNAENLAQAEAIARERAENQAKQEAKARITAEARIAELEALLKNIPENNQS
jgi:Uma2 family endonuclease